MGEHVHELRLIRKWTGGVVAQCDIQGCKKTLGILEVNRRLNTTESLMRTVGFFASVIKSGEPWTEDCETAYADARKGIEPNV